MIEIMRFEGLIEATFIKRLNRFLGVAQISDKQEKIHIHDPGRIPCLKPNTKIKIKEVKNRNRKTKYDLIAFLYNGEWIFSHSGYHSKIFERTIKNLENPREIIREVRVGSSRLDFKIDDTYVEIKGCTWIEDKNCKFPDAPTERGRRHVRELARLANKGTKTKVVFLVFSRIVERVILAEDVDPDFVRIAHFARDKGVVFEALRYIFSKDSLYYVGKVPVFVD